VNATEAQPIKKHVISALVANRPGVLAHVAGLFSARGFNIDSLAVGETEQPDFSRMTIVVAGDDAILEQVRKQLAKLIDVVKIQDFSGVHCVERDLALVQVHAPVGRRGEILELVGIFRGRVVDVGRTELMIELSGTEEKVEAFLDLVRPYGIREMVRTGRIAMARASQA
jgi:acetolactate synthase-1/3 small subunit